MTEYQMSLQRWIIDISSEERVSCWAASYYIMIYIFKIKLVIYIFVLFCNIESRKLAKLSIIQNSICPIFIYDLYQESLLVLNQKKIIKWPCQW